jgi:dephospho-CoA kinase
VPLLFIGITGEAGAGKSRVMDYLSKKERVFVLYSDDFARELSMPGEECYEAIKKAFPDSSLYEEDGSMNRYAFSGLVFKDPKKKALLEACIHPVVKKRIMIDVEEKRKSGSFDFYFLEAALLIEDGYDRLCDEIWYVCADSETRKKRLLERGYSAEKIDGIMDLQLKKEDFLCHTKETIENQGPFSRTAERIEELLKERRPK